MTRIRTFDLLRMAWRANFLQATWNYERQQGLGWAWSIAPALDRVYPPEERDRRLAEHTAYFNTQPTLASLALGVVAGLEERRAEADGAGPDPAAIARVKGVLGASLAALGDRMFWFTLRPLAACLGVAFAHEPTPLGAVVTWVSYNAMHLSVRFLGVGWGYRLGPAVLDAALRERFERMMRWWAVLGCATIGVLVAIQLVPGGVARPAHEQIALAGGLVFGLLAAQRVRPSPTEWALLAGALALVLTWRS
jgi:mannose PTS system EIID component